MYHISDIKAETESLTLALILRPSKTTKGVLPKFAHNALEWNETKEPNEVRTHHKDEPARMELAMDRICDYWKEGAA